MPFRRSAAAVLVAVALVSGCKNVTQEPAPNEIVVAAFNSPVWPASACLSPLDLRCQATVPTPNDLALQAEPTIPSVPQLAAQKALLRAFIAAGGFPSDQAVGITIPIKRAVFDAASGRYALATPPVADQATLTTTGAAANVVVMKIDVDPPVPVAVEVDAANCTTGQIALQKAASPITGSRAWAPGRYAFAMRGGAGGVKTTTGLPIGPDQAITLVAPNLDLLNPNNQPPGGLPPALAAQVDAVRNELWNRMDWNSVSGFWSCNPSNPLATCPAAASGVAAFPAVSSVIPADQVSVIGTFEVAPAVPAAPVDAASGIAPLPLDLLRTANSGTTIAYNAAFGPAAAGLTTLDGFSTTGTIFAPVTVPIDAGTVSGATVHLFKIAPDGSLTLLKELKQLLGTGGDPTTADYVAQPDPLNIASGIPVLPGLTCQAAGGCSPVVALQPGVAAPVPLLSTTFYLPPLEEATDYAVVITSGVTDVFGRPLQQSTAARMLVAAGFDPLASSSVNGTSYVTGVSDAQATALQKMRDQLAPVIAALPNGETAADVALAYTFRTESILETSLQLSVAPYGSEEAAQSALFVPLAASTTAPAGSYPNVAQFYAVTFPSIDATDKTTGALNPNQAAWGQALLDAIVAVPSAANANLSACPPPNGALMCAPLVVFGHGLGGSSQDMLAVADSLAARGFVAAAIDFPQHGARSWCYKGSDCDNGGVDGTCTPFPGGLGQGDVDPSTGLPISPGTCTVGVPKAAISGQTFISANFFRTRDALRQNLIDQAALVLALARPPASLYPIQPGSTDPFTAAIAATGVVVDPSRVYWEGISLGGIAGTNVLATNPRFGRGVTSVAGGTLVDVFTQAPAFQARVDALFTALLKPQLDAIAPGTPFTPALIDGTSASFNLGVASQYLKTTVLAKWILDPGDPLNFARNLRVSPLPDLLSPPALQPAKDVLGQVAIGDMVIPNPFNLELFTIGQVSVVEYTSTVYPPANMHGILSFDPTVQAQAATYLFNLVTPPAPPTQVTIP